MAKYTVKQAKTAVDYWKKQLDEAMAFESEEDQQKEKEQETDSDSDSDSTKSKDDEIAELKAKVEELEAKLAVQDSSDEDTDEMSDEDDSEDETPDEETEDDSDGDTEDESSDDETDDESEEEIDESAPGSTKYAPNTVGAVCELLKKSDPHDTLAIRLNPGSVECMIVDIDRKITMKNGITYMEIVKGKPM